MQTRMFYVAADSVYEDTDLDQFIEAETAQQALDLWKAGDLCRDYGPAAGSVRVFEVPALTGTPTCFNWHVPQVPCMIEHEAEPAKGD
jgi:hypothetical protein